MGVSSTIVIDRRASTAQRRRTPQPEVFESIRGPLTRDDITDISEVAGHGFKWPPREGEPAPEAALFLAQIRAMQRRAGGRSIDMASMMMSINQQQGIEIFSPELICRVAKRAL